MLKVIPVEEAIGCRWPTISPRSCPASIKVPPFGVATSCGRKIFRNCSTVGKRHLYVMELEKDELHEEDAARRLAAAAAGPNLRLTNP